MGSTPDLSKATDEQLDAQLRQIIARYARSVGSPIALGPHGTLRFLFFNDLLSASHQDQHLDVMTESLVRLVGHQRAHESATIVACPKRGNALLGHSLARRLKLNSLFVRDEALASRFVEGSYGKGEKVLLVDDVSSDGDLLLDAVEGLRREGLYVECAFTVIDRGEGNASKKLKGEGIQLHSCLSLDDDDVRAVMHEHKTERIV